MSYGEFPTIEIKPIGSEYTHDKSKDVKFLHDESIEQPPSFRKNLNPNASAGLSAMAQAFFARCYCGACTARRAQLAEDEIASIIPTTDYDALKRQLHDERAIRNRPSFYDPETSEIIAARIEAHVKAEKLSHAMSLPIAAEKSMRAQLLLRDDV